MPHPNLLAPGYVQSDESDGDPTDGLGIWEITIEPLADGEYSIFALVEDQAGNFSEASEGVAITVDTQGPQRPTIDLVNSDDTGSSDRDNVTIGDPDVAKNPEADFRISADIGTTVAIKDGNTIVDTFVFDNAFDLTDGIVDGFGIRRIDFAANEGAFGIPAEGPHPLSTESLDAAGNFTQSEELLVLIDSTSPATPDAADLLESSDTFDDVAGLIGPQWNSSDDITKINQPAFSGVAEANAKVHVFAENVATGTVQLVGTSFVQSDESNGDPTDGLGLWEVTVEPLADGEYEIQVVIEDLAGNLSQASEPLTITVDTLAPQRPTLDLLAADDTGRSDLDNVTFCANDVPFTVTAEDGSRVLIKDGETVIDDFLMVGTSMVRTLALAEGSHLLSVEAFDAAGNRSDQSEELVVTIDRTAPATPSIPDLLATSDSGVSNSDDITAVNPPAFLGTAEANTLVRVFANGELVGVARVGSDLSDGVEGDGLGLWEVTVEPLTYGQFEITSTVEDLAGNISEETEALVVVVDPFEANDTLATATILGSQPVVTVNDVLLHNLQDTDIYKLRAHETGKLVINVYSADQVDVQVWDSAGNVIATATETSPVAGLNVDQIVIPVVGQQDYFIQVFDDSVDASPGSLAHVAIYDLEVENFAAPVPSGVTLHPIDDSGMTNQDLVTFVEDAQLVIKADLAEFADEGITVLTAAEATAGDVPGAAVELFINGASVGFADPLFGLSTLFVIQLDTVADLLPDIGQWSQALEISTGRGGAMVVASDNAGYFNIVEAAVRIFDPQTTTATGRTQLSEELDVHFDPNTPDVTNDLATIEMATYSDSGVIGDYITRINQPAFLGVGEANTRIRLYAQRYAEPEGLTPIGIPDLVGQSVVGSDTSDIGAGGDGAPYIGQGGVLGDGLGLWEITVEPLDDGYYVFTMELEDIAGNSSDQDDGPQSDVITIDTLPPQRPTIDLVGPDVIDPLIDMTTGAAVGPIDPIYSDTGLSTLDNVTMGFAPGAEADSALTQYRISAEPGTDVMIKDGEEVIAMFVMPDEPFVFFNLDLDEDPHPLSVEAFDAALNRSISRKNST